MRGFEPRFDIPSGSFKKRSYIAEIQILKESDFFYGIENFFANSSSRSESRKVNLRSKFTFFYGKEKEMYGTDENK